MPSAPPGSGRKPPWSRDHDPLDYFIVTRNSSDRSTDFHNPVAIFNTFCQRLRSKLHGQRLVFFWFFNAEEVLCMFAPVNWDVVGFSERKLPSSNAEVDAHGSRT